MRARRTLAQPSLELPSRRSSLSTSNGENSLTLTEKELLVPLRLPPASRHPRPNSRQHLVSHQTRDGQCFVFNNNTNEPLVECLAQDTPVKIDTRGAVMR
jgi:hypothetical protein